VSSITTNGTFSLQSITRLTPAGHRSNRIMRCWWVAQIATKRDGSEIVFEQLQSFRLLGTKTTLVPNADTAKRSVTAHPLRRTTAETPDFECRRCNALLGALVRHFITETLYIVVSSVAQWVWTARQRRNRNASPAQRGQYVLLEKRAPNSSTDFRSHSSRRWDRTVLREVSLWLPETILEQFFLSFSKKTLVVKTNIVALFNQYWHIKIRFCNYNRTFVIIDWTNSHQSTA
jgi:hypothetical protein